MKAPEAGRLRHHPMFGSRPSDGPNGAFDVESPEHGWRLAIIACDGTQSEAQGWQHVSAHAYRKAQQRTPTWREMVFIKDLFWDENELAVQFHPRRSEYVNHHPNVLHLWAHVDIPTPPREFV